jgi:hypothetical protein
MFDASSLLLSLFGGLFALSWPFFVVAWLPVLLVAASRRTDGVEKLGWAASLIFFSWLGYLLFLFAVTLRGDAAPPPRRNE